MEFDQRRWCGEQETMRGRSPDLYFRLLETKKQYVIKVIKGWGALRIKSTIGAAVEGSRRDVLLGRMGMRTFTANAPSADRTAARLLAATLFSAPPPTHCPRRKIAVTASKPTRRKTAHARMTRKGRRGAASTTAATIYRDRARRGIRALLACVYYTCARARPDGRRRTMSVRSLSLSLACIIR